MSASLDHLRVKVLPDGRVSRSDAAVYLGYASKTLAEYARLGRGPRPRRVGGRVFYLLKDLDAFRDTGAREAG